MNICLDTIIHSFDRVLAAMSTATIVAERWRSLGKTRSRECSQLRISKHGLTSVAGYTQNVRIKSGDTIEIRDTAIQCGFSAVNRIVVRSKGRGSIVGGHHQATLSVRAK